jgi:ribosomal protein L12E/L44/L45/RPP1/RPP2
MFDPEIIEFEQKLSETFGTRVSIEQKQKGGKITIDFFSPEDLKTILTLMQSTKSGTVTSVSAPVAAVIEAAAPEQVPEQTPNEQAQNLDDRSKEEKKQDENTEELYSIKNFSL